MIFNSFTYILFLSFIIPLYWYARKQSRKYIILITSLIFYGFWDYRFIPLLFLSIFIDYGVSIIINSKDSLREKKLWLFVSIIANLSLLLFFKYFYFLENSLSTFLGLFNLSIPETTFTILLPIGISFYTFQSISYTIDVYRGEIKPEKNFVLFASYVLFFPQLVAGPILRAREVIPQFNLEGKITKHEFHTGITRLVTGLFLKVCIADNVARLVNQGFENNIEMLSVIDITTLSYLFGFQIYFDFVAYSHIAIGSALLLGIKFPENFNFPYLAANPREFWQRWHISLSSWIRDYLYLPLLGARRQNTSAGGVVAFRDRTSWNSVAVLFLTWAIMGLWHGAAWSFAIWGLWHALLIFSHRIFLKVNLINSLSHNYFKFSKIMICNFFIMIGWLPFRITELDRLYLALQSVTDPLRWFNFGLKENTYIYALTIYLFILVGPFFWKRIFVHIIRPKSKKDYIYSWIYLMFVITLTLSFWQSIEQFIYFQF
ncbi:hypothetical protein OAV66_00380 [Planktomarina temperata]|nr:hypothetical protein [Planktomarina temperata]